MKRCVIIAAYNPYGIRNCVELTENDFIICADGGYDLAVAEEIIPDVVIGDFDSIHSETVQAGKIIRVAAEKDDTDTMLCLKYGIQQGYKVFVIVGGIGGRLDHSIANIQTLSYACGFAKSIQMVNANTHLYMMSDGVLHLKKTEQRKYLSLFAMSDVCRGVSVSGVKYPLKNAILTSDIPLGISNEFVEEDVTVKVKSGKLLIVLESQA